MKFLMFAASQRKDSLNKKLLHVAASFLKGIGITPDIAEFSEFMMPLYDGDMNAAIGLPDGANKFIQRLHAADATIIVSPEYNFSIPGTLKNLIDWVSREPAKPWTNQLVALMSASPSLVGGNRGLWHARVPLEACGAIVHPDMFSLSSAHTAFSATGELQDKQLEQRLHASLTGFVKFVTQLTAS